MASWLQIDIVQLEAALPRRLVAPLLLSLQVVYFFFYTQVTTEMPEHHHRVSNQPELWEEEGHRQWKHHLQYQLVMKKHEREWLYRIVWWLHGSTVRRWVAAYSGDDGFDDIRWILRLKFFKRLVEYTRKIAKLWSFCLRVY